MGAVEEICMRLSFLFLCSVFAPYSTPSENGLVQAGSSWAAVAPGDSTDPNHRPGHEGPIVGTPPRLDTTPQSHPTNTSQHQPGGTAPKLFLFDDRILSILRGSAWMPVLDRPLV